MQTPNRWTNAMQMAQHNAHALLKREGWGEVGWGSSKEAKCVPHGHHQLNFLMGLRLAKTLLDCLSSLLVFWLICHSWNMFATHNATDCVRAQTPAVTLIYAYRLTCSRYNSPRQGSFQFSTVLYYYIKAVFQKNQQKQSLRKTVTAIYPNIICNLRYNTVSFMQNDLCMQFAQC